MIDSLFFTLWQPLWLTLQLATLSVVVLLLIALPLCYWLSQYNGRVKPVIEAAIALPLVLPPTVIGFYLLIAFAPDTVLGQSWIVLSGQPLAFSFAGIVLGSVIYSFPFVVQPILLGFQQHIQPINQTASTLGIVWWRRIIFILLPAIKPALISAVTLGFAHTLGEFGLILMIGGNIPGHTQVLSIALYQSVETMQYAQAHWLAAILLGFSFVILVIMYMYNRAFYRMQQC